MYFLPEWKKAEAGKLKTLHSYWDPHDGNTP